MPRLSQQKALSNAREYAQQHNVSQSSYVSSAVASKLRSRAAESSGNITDLGSGLDDQQKVQILNGLPNISGFIVNELNKLCNLPDPDEVKDTQPLVKQLLDVVLKVIGRKEYRWVIGKEIPRNLGFVTSTNPLQPRVFCPRSSQPDFMLENTDSTDIIGAHAEVKRDVLLYGKTLYQIQDNVRQTALYAFSYILRVFPMLLPAEIQSIFGDN
ncbi:hypothetical protein MIR68_003278 [Amoeboaphelidium protococcarum]|nr:hypothetical protein MIR68_003278 [Amoeboaphelidium protococcarum]